MADIQDIVERYIATFNEVGFDVIVTDGSRVRGVYGFLDSAVAA